MPPQAFRLNIVACRSLVLLLYVFSAQNAWACYKAPEQQLIGVDEQITAISLMAGNQNDSHCRGAASMIGDSQLYAKAMHQIPATIGLPSAALAALCLCS